MKKKFFLSKSWYQTAGVVGVCFQISFGERMDNLTHSFGVGFDTVRHFGMISETMAAAINCGQCTETQKWCLGLLVGVQRLFKSVESQNTGFGCWEDTKVEGDPEAQRDKGRQTKRKLKRQNPLSFFFLCTNFHFGVEVSLRCVCRSVWCSWSNSASPDLPRKPVTSTSSSTQGYSDQCCFMLLMHRYLPYDVRMGISINFLLMLGFQSDGSLPLFVF